MKLLIKKNFKDGKEDVSRKAGDDFIASKARYEEMVENFKKLGLNPDDYIEEVKASKK